MVDSGDNRHMDGISSIFPLPNDSALSATPTIIFGHKGFYSTAVPFSIASGGLPSSKTSNGTPTPAINGQSEPVCESVARLYPDPWRRLELWVRWVPGGRCASAKHGIVAASGPWDPEGRCTAAERGAIDIR